MKSKHAIHAKHGDLAGTVVPQEVSETATSFVRIGTFVNDGVRRAARHHEHQ